MAKIAEDRIRLRGGVYYYIRRVPKRFSHLDKRVIVRISLDTGDKRAAGDAAVLAECELEALWTSLAAQGDPDAWKRYHAAIERARLEGFVYRSASEVAEERLTEILGRMESLAGRVHDQSAATAIAGGEEKPQPRLSEALDLFFGYSGAELVGKREDQIRRWKNARKLAVKEFNECIGVDKPIPEITRDDARKFHDMWLLRIKNEAYGRNAMNKQISHLSMILGKVGEELKLDIDPIFAKLSVSERKKTRPPFDREFIEKVILAPGALDGLNLDARVSLLVCAETGMGPEEVTSLRKATIHLNAPVPYVEIESREGALQKNAEYRPRVIPLVGVALMAMRLRPNGIERYFDKPASLSAAVNKYMSENGLRPTPKHSLYSFRHSFQDRLTAFEAPDRLQADLMGHKYVREKYGKGPSLAQKQKWLRRIAYRPAPNFSV